MKEQDNQENFTWNNETQILWRSKTLFELGVRLGMLVKALHEKNANVPLTEEAKERADNISKEARAIVDQEDQQKINESSPIIDYLERYGLTDIEQLMTSLEHNIYNSGNIYNQEALNNLQLWCHILSLFYIDIHKECDKGNSDILYSLNILDDRISRKANEALGYWTPKLKELHSGNKGNETKRLKEKKKIELVHKAYIKFINSHNNPTAKNALSKLSKNEMARQVIEIAIDDVKNQIGDGLSVTTVIRYLDQQDFNFYPWKRKTAK